MSVTKATGGRAVLALMLVIAAASILLATGALDAAAGASNPFGGPRAAPRAASPTAWSAGSSPSRPSSRSRMRDMLRAAKADGSAVWGLLGLSFLYGIFHAAGPGHGKAVISSYVVANDETWRRGVVLSFASAMLQAFVAVAFVGIAAWVFNATMATMCKTERWIEIVSYALIALIGLRLVWVKGRAFFNTARSMGRPLHAVGAAVTPPHDHKHGDARPSCTITSTIITTTTAMHHGHDHARPSRTTTTIITTTRTSTPRPGAMRTGRSRRSWPGRAAGGAACRRSSQWACGRARARSWCWCSRWRRACCGPASLRPS